MSSWCRTRFLDSILPPVIKGCDSQDTPSSVLTPSGCSGRLVCHPGVSLRHRPYLSISYTLRHRWDPSGGLRRCRPGCGCHPVGDGEWSQCRCLNPRGSSQENRIRLAFRRCYATMQSGKTSPQRCERALFNMGPTSLGPRTTTRGLRDSPSLPIVDGLGETGGVPRKLLVIVVDEVFRHHSHFIPLPRARTWSAVRSRDR